MSIINKPRILVSSCGGDIGQSIGKILNSETDFYSAVFGADCSEEHAGIFIFKSFFKLPLCRESNYISKLRGIIAENKINLILPTSEAEIKFFIENNFSKKIDNVDVILPSSKALQVGFDKLRTVQFLSKHKLMFPKTQIIKNVICPCLPSILKSREGAGSKSVFRVESDLDFEYLKQKYPDSILQEYLTPDNEEYTCGLFRSKCSEIRSIVFRRKMIGDQTGFGITVSNAEIEALLISLATALDLVGSINVQLRLTNRGPVIFEINPRFSSTVYFRHLLGFKDVIWSIQDRLNLPLGTYTMAPEGKKIYKGYAEFIN